MVKFNPETMLGDIEFRLEPGDPPENYATGLYLAIMDAVGSTKSADVWFDLDNTVTHLNESGSSGVYSEDLVPGLVDVFTALREEGRINRVGIYSSRCLGEPGDENEGNIHSFLTSAGLDPEETPAVSTREIDHFCSLNAWHDLMRSIIKHLVNTDDFNPDQVLLKFDEKGELGSSAPKTTGWFLLQAAYAVAGGLPGCSELPDLVVVVDDAECRVITKPRDNRHPEIVKITPSPEMDGVWGR